MTRAEAINCSRRNEKKQNSAQRKKLAKMGKNAPLEANPTLIEKPWNIGELETPKPKNFYRTSEWLKLRQYAFKMFGNKCMCCGHIPSKIKTHVDHIKPVCRFPELRLMATNVQILCERCNLDKGMKTRDYRSIQQIQLARAIQFSG